MNPALSVGETRRGLSQLSPIESALLRSALDQSVASVSWDAVRLVLQLVELPVEVTFRSWDELCWLALRAEKNLLVFEDKIIWEALSHEDQHAEKFVATLQNWLTQTRELLEIAPLSKPVEKALPKPVHRSLTLREKMLLGGFVAAIAFTILMIVLALAGGFKKPPRTKAHNCSSATCNALSKPIALLRVS